MKLWLTPTALVHTFSGIPPKGALYTCHLLKEKGFELSTTFDDIIEPASAILSGEELFSDFEPLLADAKVIENEDESFSFWIGDSKISDGTSLADLFPALDGSLKRTATINRKTNETDISISLNLDGTGKTNISTGLNFFDHMLDQIGKHGFVDLDINCDGDLQVDEHHTIEDVAIALGDAITQALGDKKGIERYSFVLPMDEAQATVALDLSGRPYLVFEGEFNREYVGDMPTEMVKHFFYSLAMNLKATLQISFKGENDHHKIEACFKGFARCLKTSVEKNPRILNQIPSSKGAL